MLDYPHRYTLEASFMGGVGGRHKDAQFTTRDLLDPGRHFCAALVRNAAPSWEFETPSLHEETSAQVGCFGLDEEVAQHLRGRSILLKVWPDDRRDALSTMRNKSMRLNALISTRSRCGSPAPAGRARTCAKRPHRRRGRDADRP